MPNLQHSVLGNRFRLRPDVELLEGADGAPMLFDARSGRYVRLGRQAARVVRDLDGTRSGADIAETLAVSSGVGRDRIDAQLAQLLSELSASGVFEGEASPAPPSSRKTRLAGAVSRTPTWHLPLLREGLTRLVDPVSRLLRAAPATLRVPAAATLAGAALTVAVTALSTSSLPFTPKPWLLAMVALLLQTVLHELGHAVSCRVHGVRPRELGIALWYGVIPIAYVDRTDAYRVRSRGGRAAISIVGPLQDLCWTGVYGAVALGSSGLVHSVAVAATVLGLTMTVVNLNPLLPTDGQQALEAALGELNLRGRAMAYLAHLVLRNELPTYLKHLTRRRKAVYLMYGTACAVYVLLVVTGMTWWLLTLGTHLLGGL